MNLYKKHVLPRLVNFACTSSTIMAQRKEIVPQADGRVLEIGIGSGLNLPLYSSEKVTHLIGLDPSQESWNLSQNRKKDFGFSIEFSQGTAEDIPLESNSVDTVLLTYTMCSIENPGLALREMGRVLADGGKILFCEHGLAPEKSVQRWQHGLNPFWKRIGGGCNLNRSIADLIREAGFTIKNLKTEYIPGWKPVSYNYWGMARP
jgi:ubiquinone/menaquinone biosynthesis C-methylase UbiE